MSRVSVWLGLFVLELTARGPPDQRGLPRRWRRRLGESTRSKLRRERSSATWQPLDMRSVRMLVNGLRDSAVVGPHRSQLLSDDGHLDFERRDIRDRPLRERVDGGNAEYARSWSEGAGAEVVGQHVALALVGD